MPVLKRRKFSKEFKTDALQLVLDQGYTPPQAATSLGISANVLRRWIREAEARRGANSASGEAGVLSESEREELKRLRRDNKRLEMEREILKKATAFFAKESH